MPEIDALFDPDVRREQNKKYAKKESEKGFYSVGLAYKNGIVIVSHNHRVRGECWKIREVHNNIAMVGAGRTSDIEEVTEKATDNADTIELLYSEKDVTAKNLARLNIARYVRGRFHTSEPVCAIMLLAGIDSGKNMLYKILFDGEIVPCENFASIGGEVDDGAEYANWIEKNCAEKYRKDLPLDDAIIFGVDCIVSAHEGEYRQKDKSTAKRTVFEKELGAAGAELEIAVLDRTIPDIIKFAPIGSENRQRQEFAPLKQNELQDLLAHYEK